MQICFVYSGKRNHEKHHIWDKVKGDIQDNIQGLLNFNELANSFPNVYVRYINRNMNNYSDKFSKQGRTRH